jgi:hypothetical protein
MINISFICRSNHTCIFDMFNICINSIRDNCNSSGWVLDSSFVFGFLQNINRIHLWSSSKFYPTKISLINVTKMHWKLSSAPLLHCKNQYSCHSDKHAIIIMYHRILTNEMMIMYHMVYYRYYNDERLWYINQW